MASHSPSAMSSEEQSVLEAAVVGACSKHKQARQKEHGYRACICNRSEYFVKFDYPETLWPEIATQKYISESARSHCADAPRIPRVKHHFEDQHTLYLVVEYITLSDPPPNLTEKIAEALKWLSEIPAPPGHALGPLGGGLIRHQIFKEYEAPLVFSSIGALERFMEKGRSRLSKLATNPVKPISFDDERVRPSHGSPNIAAEPVTSSKRSDSISSLE